MEENLNIQLQYDQIGEKYLQGQKKFFSKRDDWTRNAILMHLRDVKNKTILDIGCGGGEDIKLLEQQGAIVYGIDPSKTMVSSAQAIVAHPERLRVGDYEHIPFPDKEFDIVFGSFSLHYLKTFEKAYEEIYRVLKPSGLMLQIVSHPSFDLSYLLEEGHQNQPLITVGLFHKAVKVTFPPHSVADYFSPAFLKLFDLTDVEEYKEEEVDKAARVPGALLYIATVR